MKNMIKVIKMTKMIGWVGGGKWQIQFWVGVGWGRERGQGVVGWWRGGVGGGRVGGGGVGGKGRGGGRGWGRERGWWRGRGRKEKGGSEGRGEVEGAPNPQ